MKTEELIEKVYEYTPVDSIERHTYNNILAVIQAAEQLEIPLEEMMDNSFREKILELLNIPNPKNHE